jgi:hypothetical protein
VVDDVNNVNMKIGFQCWHDISQTHKNSINIDTRREEETRKIQGNWEKDGIKRKDTSGLYM